MKLSRILSALAIVNFLGVTFISNSLSFMARENSSTPIPILATPTPIVVIKKTVAQPSQTQPPAQNNRCIVIIDGVSYDLTNFVNIHSGGNIFNCGTDMSQTFWSQHSQKQLNQLQQYRI